MRLYNMASYCGGGFLTGFYRHETIQANPELFTKDVMDDIAKRQDSSIKYANESLYGPSAFTSQGVYAPYSVFDDKDENLIARQMLKKLVSARYANILGTIIAVTNSSQNYAHPFFKQLGFIPSITTSKLGVGAGGQCITWLADYHRTVAPVLNKTPDYVLKGGKPKNAKF